MTVVVRSAFSPFSAVQMFDLVNDIESYPSFLPWCAAAQILESDPGSMKARLKIRRGRFDYSFTTENRLTRGRRIELHLIDGPFRRFGGAWTFSPTEGGSLVKLDLEFEFKSRVLGIALTAAFKPVADSLVEAFRSRAYNVYES